MSLSSSILIFFGGAHQDAWEDAGAEERAFPKTQVAKTMGILLGGLDSSPVFFSIPDPKNKGLIVFKAVNVLQEI